jgi:hypothetical protein
MTCLYLGCTARNIIDNSHAELQNLRPKIIDLNAKEYFGKPNYDDYKKLKSDNASVKKMSNSTRRF